MNQPPPQRHSFKALMFVPPQGFAGGEAKPLAPPAAPVRRKSSPPPLPTAKRLAFEEARSPNDSHVRLRPPPPALVGSIEFLDAADLLDELCEDQLNFSINLACLEKAVEDGPRDPSARAALGSLASRVQDLGVLRDALARLHLLTADPRLQRLFVPESPLADYLRGIYAWTHSVVRALDNLAVGLQKLQPDWAMTRWRLEEAKNFHFDDLEESIRGDITALAIVVGRGVLESVRGPRDSAPPAIPDLSSAVGAVFAAARKLETNLDERFG